MAELDETYRPQRGDLIGAHDGIAFIDVIRVSAGKWADIRVTQLGGATWSKRQPLPWHISGTLLLDGNEVPA